MGGFEPPSLRVRDGNVIVNTTQAKFGSPGWTRTTISSVNSRAFYVITTGEHQENQWAREVSIPIMGSDLERTVYNAALPAEAHARKFGTRGEIRTHNLSGLNGAPLPCVGLRGHFFYLTPSSTRNRTGIHLS